MTVESINSDRAHPLRHQSRGDPIPLPAKAGAPTNWHGQNGVHGSAERSDHVRRELIGLVFLDPCSAWLGVKGYVVESCCGAVCFWPWERDVEVGEDAALDGGEPVED